MRVKLRLLKLKLPKEENSSRMEGRYRHQNESLEDLESGQKKAEGGLLCIG